MSDEEINEIPNSVLEFVRKRSNRDESSRFPHKLWILLNWSGQNERRGELCGCGWTSDEVFFIEKTKLCEVLDIKINTLNVNLKTLGFKAAGNRNKNITYWRNPVFHKSSNPQDFGRIRNSRSRSPALMNLTPNAVYFPLLENIRLYGMDQQKINTFKCHVVDSWEYLVGSSLIFAVGFNDFTQTLYDKVSPINFQFLPQTLITKYPNVVGIFDFAIFLARFGPFNDINIKLTQYRSVTDELSKNEIFINSSYTQMAFHNCFRFQLAQDGEYHCYNMPTFCSEAQFLIDEDGTAYSSWESMLRQNSFIKDDDISPMGYNSYPCVLNRFPENE